MIKERRLRNLGTSYIMDDATLPRQVVYWESLSNSMKRKPGRLRKKAGLTIYVKSA